MITHFIVFGDQKIAVNRYLRSSNYGKGYKWLAARKGNCLTSTFYGVNESTIGVRVSGIFFAPTNFLFFCHFLRCFVDNYVYLIVIIKMYDTVDTLRPEPALVKNIKIVCLHNCCLESRRRKLCLVPLLGKSFSDLYSEFQEVTV